MLDLVVRSGQVWINIAVNSLEKHVECLKHRGVWRAAPAVLLRGDLVQIKVHVHLESLPHLEELAEGLLDEDDSNQSCKCFLCEPKEKTDGITI